MSGIPLPRSGAADSTSTSNPLAPVLVDTTRLARRLQADLRNTREALHAALDVLATQLEACDHKDAIILQLKAEVRACVSGRTIAEERQQLQDERSGDAPAAAE
jgi:hypothetical protein